MDFKKSLSNERNVFHEICSVISVILQTFGNINKTIDIASDLQISEIDNFT